MILYAPWANCFDPYIHLEPCVFLYTADGIYSSPDSTPYRFRLFLGQNLQRS